MEINVQKIDNGYLVTQYSEQAENVQVFCKTLAKVNKLIKAIFNPPVDNGNVAVF